MTKHLLKIPGILGLQELFKRVAAAYPGLAFSSGTEADFTQDSNTYPLCFLETDFESQTGGNLETYSISMLIADAVNEDPTEDDFIQAMSKTEQIFDEFYHELNKYVHRVGEVSKATIRSYENDSVVITRGNFDITIGRYTPKIETSFDPVDLTGFEKR